MDCFKCAQLQKQLKNLIKEDRTLNQERQEKIVQRMEFLYSEMKKETDLSDQLDSLESFVEGLPS